MSKWDRIFPALPLPYEPFRSRTWRGAASASPSPRCRGRSGRTRRGPGQVPRRQCAAARRSKILRLRGGHGPSPMQLPGSFETAPLAHASVSADETRMTSAQRGFVSPTRSGVTIAAEAPRRPKSLCQFSGGPARMPTISVASTLPIPDRPGNSDSDALIG